MSRQTRRRKTEAARWAIKHLPPPPPLPPHEGGDNSDGAAGIFLEGYVLRGASTDAADAAVQADVNAFYSQASFI